MEVHECPRVLFDLPSVDKYFGEAQAVADVCRAASPLPALVFAVEALLLLVTATVTQVTLRTGRRDGMCHPCRNDGVGERRLFTAWRSRNKKAVNKMLQVRIENFCISRVCTFLLQFKGTTLRKELDF